MKKLILSVAMFALVTTGLLCGQMGPANIAGTLYASNFTGWTVAQGNNGPFSWSSSAVCTAAASGGVSFQPFHVGTPISIIDGTSPTLNEIVVPTAVNINGSGCSITVNPVNKHFSFYLATATAGLQEAINYANGRTYMIYVTPDFSRSGGTTAMITGAAGNSEVTILDQRSSVIVPYLWNGTNYVATPFGGGGNGNVNPSTVPLPIGYYQEAGNTISPNPIDTVDAQGTITITANGNPSQHALIVNSTFDDPTLLAPQVVPLTAEFGGPGGFNYGPNAANVIHGWSTGGVAFWNTTFNRRGITQQFSGQAIKNATGDNAWLYCNNCSSVGGTTGAADEGLAGVHINGGEIATAYSGTTSSGGVSPITISAGQTCDGCFMVNTSMAGATGHFLAPAAFVANGGYYSALIDTTVTPSTGQGVMTSCVGSATGLPQLANQTVPQSATCTFSSLTGAFAAGIATIAGQFTQQIMITSATPPSGGTQAVTFLYTHPQALNTTTLWQGGPQGNVVCFAYYQSIATLPFCETVFGAIDSTHLALGINSGGTIVSPFLGAMNPQSLSNIVPSGTTVTASAPGASGLWNKQTQGVLSGCSSAPMNGTVTAITLNPATSILSWTYPGGGTSCTNATLNLNPTYTAFQLFPYAEQIASYTAGAVSLEPHINWPANSAIVEPHPPTFSGVGMWVASNIDNPNPNNLYASFYSNVGGAGISSNYHGLRLVNQNLYTKYGGTGGTLTPPMWISLEGPNGGLMSGLFPEEFKAAFQIGCPASGCSANPELLFQINNQTGGSVGTQSYLPAMGLWNFSPGITVPTAVISGTGGLQLNTGNDARSYASYGNGSGLVTFGQCGSIIPNYMCVGNPNQPFAGGSTNYAADGNLAVAGLFASANSTINGLWVGEAIPTDVPAPVYSGAAGSVSIGYGYIAQTPLGLTTPQGTVFHLDNISATGGGNTVTIPCPTALQPGYAAGTTYVLIKNSVINLGTCALGATIVDDGSVTTPITPNTINATAPLVAGRIVDAELGTGTSPICPNGTAGALSTVGCSSPSVGGVTITGTPAAGMVPTATSGTTATWQTPATGFTGTCAATTTLTVVNGKITGCS